MSLSLVDVSTGVVSGSVPSFISFDSARFTVSVRTWDNADIGFYRMRPFITMHDTTATCPNQPIVYTDFSLIVFGMTISPLANHT